MLGPRWFKSSRTNADVQQCVEVAVPPGGGWLVRDSKNPAGVWLSVPAGQFQAFVSGVKAGEFR